jgi:glutamine synthetase
MPAHYLRHYWSDNAGLYRAKVEVDGRATGSGVGLAHADQAQCAMHRDLAPGAGIGALGDLKLVPDSATWVPLPHRERTFRVFGDMYENGAAWPLCPRAFLKAAVAEASSMGYRIRAAFEPEFYLLKRRGKIVHPMDDGAYGDAPLLDALDAWMDASLTSLEVQKVMAEGFHHESGPGQYEISIRPNEPVKAADDIITLRDTIQGISRDFGRTATFCPKPFPNSTLLKVLEGLIRRL